MRSEFIKIFNSPFIGAFKFRLRDLRIIMWSKKAEEITGFSQSNKMLFSDIFFSPEHFRSFINLLRNEGKLEGVKIQIYDYSSRQTRWALVCARLSNSGVFADGILLDVTDQHNQMLELEQVNTELDNFTYHASHDLRAPLTTILGLINLGLRETDASVVHTFMEMIRERIIHMDFLLKDLLSISYNKKKEPIATPFDFDAEIKSIIMECYLPGNPCEIDISLRQNTVFMTDSIRMRTILRNLMANSFKYYNPTVGNPFIKLKIRVHNSHTAIKLQDNGVGIDFAHKNRIFDMFFRATSASTGAGLGLYIVKSMAEKLNGNISFETTLDYGTTFLLTIPNLIAPEKLGSGFSLTEGTLPEMGEFIKAKEMLMDNHVVLDIEKVNEKKTSLTVKQ